MEEHDKSKPSATAPAKKQKWSKKKKIWVIVGVVVAVFIILFVVTNAATSAPVKVSNELVSDIQSKNAAAAYGLLSSGAQGVVPADQFSQVVSQIGPILSGTPKMISKEVSGQTGSAATAKVVYDIQGSDGVAYRMTVNLTKDNGQWKVLNFDNSKK